MNFEAERRSSARPRAFLTILQTTIILGCSRTFTAADRQPFAWLRHSAELAIGPRAFTQGRDALTRARLLSATVVGFVAVLSLWLTVRLLVAPRATPLSLDLKDVSTVPPASIGRGPEVRVLVSARTASRINLRLPGSATLTAVGDAQQLAQFPRGAELAVTATPTGLQLGDQAWPIARLEITPLDDGGVWVGEHRYRGRVQLFRQPQQRVVAVNVVPLEAYVASTIDGEMPATFPEAARQAQAIVARTYVLAKMEQADPSSLFDVYASERSQKYLGLEYRDDHGRRLAGESEQSRKIAAETAGVVLTYQNRIFATYYSAVCGGHTTQGTDLFPDAAPPHQAVPCEFCQDAERYRWQVELTTGEFLEAVGKLGRSRLNAIKTIRTPTPPGEGRLPTFEVTDGPHTATFTALELRQQLSSGKLPGVQFALVRRLDRVAVDGRGHGHGVGLCQWGARGQALAGRTWSQILRHYYPGAKLVRLEY